jgi:hypothetical protein
VPKWVVSLALNRLVLVVVIMIALRTYGAWRGEAGGGAQEWIRRALPFDEINGALR